MKRKKWTEEEEETLISEYSTFLSSGSLTNLQSREKKFRPIADRVNAAHHLRDPSSFPFLWSWRDVSIKIQNMRHQYLGVKLKILLPRAAPNDEFDWDSGVHLWSNFLRYKHAFGDIHIDLSNSKEDADEEEEEEEELEADGESSQNGEHEFKELVDGYPAVGKLGVVGRRVVELAKASLRRDEKRRAREEEGSRRRAREHRWEMEIGALRRRDDDYRERWRRREERREEEVMEWRERMLVLQMEQEKQAMQMHADACQAQMQTLGVLARLVCQFLGQGVGGSDGGLPQQVGHGLHQHRQSPGSLAEEDGKNDSHSDNHYL